VELPDIDIKPRVWTDIQALLAFVDRSPWGNQAARASDIYQGMKAVVEGPTANAVSVRRRRLGLELRRHTVAQFAIIYIYRLPNAAHPNGLVSFRAVRHGRVENVFRGVRETATQPYGIPAVRQSCDVVHTQEYTWGKFHRRVRDY
jgi:hypothetical protein